MASPNVPLDEEQIAALIATATDVGGYHVTEVCDYCKESLLLALPSKRAEKASMSSGWKRKRPTYAIVCAVCDDAYKMPKLLTDGI